MDILQTRRAQLILWAAIAGVALIVVLIVASASSGGGGFRLLGLGDDPQAGVPVPRQILGGVAGAAAPEQQDSVVDFARAHGDPPNTDFARMRIPSIGVDAPVGRWLVDDSIMPEPYGPVDVAFYDLSQWLGLGGFPGEGRNAVFGGHVDLNRNVAYAGGAHYRGPAVFWRLDALTPGSVIELDYAGETIRYAVAWIEEVDASDSTDWYSYWSSNVPVDSITLFTCGGEFNFETHAYSHRTIVRAERID